MRFLRGLSVAISVGLCTPPVSAQTPGPARTGFPDQLRYLLAQAGSGFTEIRGDSIGPDAWRGRYRLVAELDSVTAFGATSISVLSRQHADGRPGKAMVGIFPVALVGPTADSTTFMSFQELVSATVPAWQKRGPGNWSECPDPHRGREVLLFPTKTASGEMLLALSITVHPDPACS
jgi:hypothetical protein